MSVSMKQAIALAKEIIEDVEKEGVEVTKERWPDLYETYLHAKKFFKDAGHENKGT